MIDRQWWDTDFYIEQWASLHPTIPRTLVLHSKISYVGTSQKDVITRTLPIIFACNLPKLSYWKNAQQVTSQSSSQLGVATDYNWAALTAATSNVGIGIVTSKTMIPSLFSYSNNLNSTTQCDNNGPLSVIFPGGGAVDLATLGTLTNAVEQTNGTVIFNPNGTFDWTTYYPIGTIDQIRSAANILLGVIPQIQGSVDRVTCDQPNTAGWVTDDRNPTQRVTFRLEAYPIGEPSNKFIKYGTLSPNPDPPLASYCPPDGSCTFGITLGTLPNSFANKQIIVNVYGVAPDGENLIQSAPNLIGPCTNIAPLSSPTPTPVPTPTPSPTPNPGDIDRNRVVNGADLKLVVSNWLGVGPCSIYLCNLNTDQKINSLDAASVIYNFGMTW